MRGDLRVLALAADEPAADGVVRLARSGDPSTARGPRSRPSTRRARGGPDARRTVAERGVAERSALGGSARHPAGIRPRVQRHRVRVRRQPRARLEHDVGLGERHRLRAVERQRAPSGQSRHAERTASGSPSRERAPAGRRRSHRACRARFPSRRASRRARTSPGRPRAADRRRADGRRSPARPAWDRRCASSRVPRRWRTTRTPRRTLSPPQRTPRRSSPWSTRNADHVAERRGPGHIGERARRALIHRTAPRRDSSGRLVLRCCYCSTDWGAPVFSCAWSTCWSPSVATSILRGLALSLTGIVTLSTPLL